MEWRYRSPSISTKLGITKLKKEIRKQTGINAIARWEPTRVAQRIKQKLGWYSKPLRDLRAIANGQIRNPLNKIPTVGDD